MLIGRIRLLAVGCNAPVWSASSCLRIARRKVSSMNALTSACVRGGGGVLRVRTGGGETVDGRVFVEVME